MQISNWTNPSKTNVIVYEYQTKETDQNTKAETRTEAKTNTEAKTYNIHIIKAPTEPTDKPKLVDSIVVFI